MPKLDRAEMFFSLSDYDFVASFWRILLAVVKMVARLHVPSWADEIESRSHIEEWVNSRSHVMWKVAAAGVFDVKECVNSMLFGGSIPADIDAESEGYKWLQTLDVPRRFCRLLAASVFPVWLQWTIVGVRRDPRATVLWFVLTSFEDY